MENQQEGFGTLGLLCLRSYYLSLFGNGIVITTLCISICSIVFQFRWR